MRKHVAQRLRANLTDAERRLWAALRYRQLAGFRFRRQAPLGPYVVDFVCFSPRTVIEVDGGQHAWRHSADAAREAWLKAQGFTVLRFWNNEVFENLPGVLHKIEESLKARATERCSSSE